MSVRMPYAEYVAQDLRAIEARAMALYALSDHERAATPHFELLVEAVSS